MATRSLGTVLKIGETASATKVGGLTEIGGMELSCLLYTSDAADEL